MAISNTAIMISLTVLAIFFVMAFSMDYMTGYITKSGQLTIGNAVPAVQSIFLNGQLASSDSNDVIIDPVANSTKTVYVKITISDDNGDCDTFTDDNATVYFCNGTETYCDASNAAHVANLTYNATDGQWGPGDIYCNMSGNVSDVYFYEINGTWWVNATLTDGINDSTPLEKNWTYGALASFDYAPSNTVNFGVLTINQWNNGTGYERLQNTGNIVLNLTWNASNFTGQNFAQHFNITGENFVIDDDNDGSGDTDNLPQVYLNPGADENVRVQFVPTSGLLRCTSQGCTNSNATLDVYWHINIPAGLIEDTYQNTIETASTYW